MSADDIRFLPAGDEALLIDLGSRQRASAGYEAIRALVAADTLRLGCPRDIVPGAATVLVDGVSRVGAWREALATALRELSAATSASRQADPHVIDVDYGGSDLDAVAAAWGCSAEAAIARHTSAVFTVAFCGFAPGFAYCTSDPALPAVPRRDSPRARVPAGSVALAAEFCGVYPREMPGGWQLIGTTAATMFDPRRDPPALLAPGERVRFEAT